VVDNSNPTNLTRYQGKGNAAAVQACLAANACHEVGFDAFRGDPFFQLDTRVSKIIKIGEHSSLELLTQLFNLTNRANYIDSAAGNENDISANPTKNTFMQPIGYINPSSTVIPRAFSAEFGFRFSF